MQLSQILSGEQSHEQQQSRVPFVVAIMSILAYWKDKTTYPGELGQFLNSSPCKAREESPSQIRR